MNPLLLIYRFDYAMDIRYNIIHIWWTNVLNNLFPLRSEEGSCLPITKREHANFSFYMFFSDIQRAWRFQGLLTSGRNYPFFFVILMAGICRMKRKLKLGTRILIHFSVGCLIGMLFLHPSSMLIFSLTGHKISGHIFAPEHLLMIVYFALIGGAFGIINAISDHKKALLYQEIELLSITDELTSVFNRRYFTSQLNKELERSRRYDRPLSIFMIDLDNFKQYNDAHGHQSGDEMLREVANLLKKSARKPDFVARYGGDEFVIVMPEADKNKALKMADRLQAEVESANFKDRTTHAQVRFTISFGLATFPDDAQYMDGLITKADTMLYKMKKYTFERDD